MSESDQPSTPPLTRRQLREMQRTGATPVITEEATEEPAQPVPAVPLARAAEPASIAPAPQPDASVDLGVAPLTRRQAREQERIRTASIPVVSPEPTFVPPAEPIVEPTTEEPAHEEPQAHSGPVELETELGLHEEEAAVTVSDDLGSELLAGEVAPVELPPSFDQLLTRETAPSGTATAANALILSQTPAAAPLVGPVTATGEVIVTGTFDLPEGLGSRGHARGTTDGPDADAVLIDGELPPASSPTPIAASAAISTVKAADEIIRPPAPEKGNKLMLALAITAGALALALVGVLVLAVSTGVFS